MKRTLILVSACVAVLSVASAHDHEDFQKTMKATGANFGTLRKTVEAKQGPETAAAAEKLVPLYKEVQEHFEEHKMQDGITMAKTGQEAAANLAAAAKSGDWDKAAELKTIGGTCQGCHTAHREKLPDGTYKMK
jgi:cytochrome c556